MSDQTDTTQYRISIEPRGTPTFTPTDLITGLATAMQLAEDAWQERLVNNKDTITIAVVSVDTQRVVDVYDGKGWWSQQQDYD